jgi:hypothetical protein
MGITIESDSEEGAVAPVSKDRKSAIADLRTNLPISGKPEIGCGP